MSNALKPLSASVTRILSLVGFPKELKTKDIQAAFSEWENVQGGFRIKWIDDTSLLIVFNEATVAKRAYLNALANPPESIFGNNSVAVIKPYDGADAQTIIQTVNSRHATSASRGHNSRGSISSTNGGHGRMASMGVRNNGFTKPSNGSIPEHPNMNISTSTNGAGLQYGREPSPTLPNIPSQPTLNSLIANSPVFGDDAILHDPAIVAAGSMSDISAGAGAGSGPRIGNPGKRMLGAALGVRHPGLGPRNVSGGVVAVNGTEGGQLLMNEMQKAMGGLVVSD
ncbi:hypothetical protein SCHPADRAFT_992082 [Schizopora paradoxa]|uniref:RRM domain-containing protein n=1 Tax=Schizopora paradoxa TaxID=27342 RepID=A0A0H2S8Z6_9AGAM|nr:hypothetical protein SCHPADRAFT_992082 [Schizopora paradoxa]